MYFVSTTNSTKIKITFKIIKILYSIDFVVNIENVSKYNALKTILKVEAFQL